jgi:hypothetical protein
MQAVLQKLMDQAGALAAQSLRLKTDVRSRRSNDIIRMKAWLPNAIQLSGFIYEQRAVAI